MPEKRRAGRGSAGLEPAAVPTPGEARRDSLVDVRVSSADPPREQHRSPVTRVSGGRVWIATVAVTVATVALQWVRVRDTFFAIDDFIFLGIARTKPFGLHLLRMPIFEHFSPSLWTANKAEVGPLHANHGLPC